MNWPFEISDLTGVTEDSRKVEAGYLFAALQGQKSDGMDYIPQAIEAGAKVVLSPRHCEEGEARRGNLDSGLLRNPSILSGIARNDEVVFFESENPRLEFAKICAAFYGDQPEHLVAVTGTNGKSSVVHFVQQFWNALGLKSASLGTLGLQAGIAESAVPTSGSMTTPGSETLHESLANLKNEGYDHVALEASSHGLDQYRLHGAKIKAAGFTNLSRDHLDYHHDMGHYFAAKAKLFSEILEDGGRAVINADDGYGQILLSSLRGSEADEVIQYRNNHSGLLHDPSILSGIVRNDDVDIVSYGENEQADIRLLSCVPGAQGQDIEIEVFGETICAHVPLVGKFQIMNVLCALGLIERELVEGKREILTTAIEMMKTVPGRLQSVPGHPKEAGVYVDYAHTPDALEKVLDALRPHTKSKLVCVFGCGGDRDQGKRAEMGDVANRLADITVITDDNPRSEDPSVIRQQILQAAPHAKEIGDRREAIHKTIQDLDDGDVLIIAGKGHEKGQIFADRTEDFDDVQEAQKAIEEFASGQ